MRFRRALTVATLAALAAAGLTACESKVGMAASVSGQRLSDSSLAGYVKPGAKPYTDQSTGTTVVPKLFALETWIDERLFAHTVAERGGAATNSEKTAAEAAALGTRTRADYEKFYGNLGYTKEFSDLIIDQSVMLVILVQRLAKVSATDAVSVLQSGQAGPSLLKAVNASKPDVVVSPRYGTWDPTRLALSSDRGSGLPDFVHYPGSGGSSDEPTPAP